MPERTGGPPYEAAEPTPCTASGQGAGCWTRPCATLDQAVTAAAPENLVRICSEILAPLIRQDGGELYLVEARPERIVLHLAGRCSGCPGMALTTASIIEPALRAAMPAIEVIVTAGIQVPPDAKMIEADGTPPSGAP
jgi:Fe-S cluster biogenesis protein NfuA